MLDRGCITNLPDDATVEAPGHVDRKGIGQMADEMLVAQAKRLPRYAGAPVSPPAAARRATARPPPYEGRGAARYSDTRAQADGLGRPHRARSRSRHAA